MKKNNLMSYLALVIVFVLFKSVKYIGDSAFKNCGLRLPFLIKILLLLLTILLICDIIVTKV